MNSSEYILFKVRDESWPQERYFNATLITYDSGEKDFHLQTGEFHKAAIEFANSLLQSQNLKIGKGILIGPSGIYYDVEEISKEKK